MIDLNDLIGQKFGRLVVIEFSHTDNHRNRYFKCQCECGKQCIVQYGGLTTGHSKSCGCLQLDIVTNSNYGLLGSKCGHSKPRVHSSKYKGVGWRNDKNKWCAGIKSNYKHHFLGYFDNEEEAARAYNEAALRLHKKPVLNVIEGD